MLRRLESTTRVRRRLPPSVRLGAAGLAAVGGAYLISVWMVGVVLILEALFYGLVVWDDGKPSGLRERERLQHGQVLDRWRQSR